jgi:hypothetical protein
MNAMDIEAQLRRLEARYRLALSASVGAKAHYLALEGAAASIPSAIERAKLTWRRHEVRKASLVAQMDELERLEQE